MINPDRMKKNVKVGEILRTLKPAPKCAVCNDTGYIPFYGNSQVEYCSCDAGKETARPGRPVGPGW